MPTPWQIDTPAARLTIGDVVTHDVIGAVTIADIDAACVQIQDDTGNTVWVPAAEIL